MADNNYQNDNQNDNQNQQYYQGPVQNMNYAPEPPKEEKASVGLAILSFFIPLAGLIIFITDKSKKPKTAKVCGICALVSFIISVAFSVIMTVSGGLFASSILDDGDSSYSQGEDAGTVQAEGEDSAANDTLGDYKCTVKGAELCKDYEGKDAVLVTFEFTNNSSDAASFDIALDAKAFQDGIGLESAYLADEETDGLVDVEIKPGVTKEVKKAYILRDTTTAVEMEIAEWLSFDDSKIVTTIEIAK